MPLSEAALESVRRTEERQRKELQERKDKYRNLDPKKVRM